MSKYKKLRTKYMDLLDFADTLEMKLERTEGFLQSAESALIYKENEIEHKNRLLKSLIES